MPLVAAAMIHADGRTNGPKKEQIYMKNLIGTFSEYANELIGYVSPTFQGRVSGVFCTNSWIFLDWEKFWFCCFYIRSHFFG